MSTLPRGLYEQIVTEALAGLLAPADRVGDPEVADLRAADAADRIAWPLAKVIERRLDDLPEKERVAKGAYQRQTP